MALASVCGLNLQNQNVSFPTPFDRNGGGNSFQGEFTGAECFEMPSNFDVSFQTNSILCPPIL